jgi:hypothetical protein
MNPPNSAPAMPSSMGDDHTSRIFPRHDELGQRSDNQTKDDPAQNSQHHSSFALSLRADAGTRIPPHWRKGLKESTHLV